MRPSAVVILAVTLGAAAVARADGRFVVGAGAEATLDDQLGATVVAHGGVGLAPRWWWMGRGAYGVFTLLDPAGSEGETRSRSTEVRTGPTWLRCGGGGCWGVSSEVGVRSRHERPVGFDQQLQSDQRTTAVLGDVRVRGQLHLIAGGRLSLEANLGLRLDVVEWTPGLALGAALTGRL